MDAEWWTRALDGHDPRGAAPDDAAADRSVVHLDVLLRAWAIGFASRREDVARADLSVGSRGLHPDEAAALLAAVDRRHVHVDTAGFAVCLSSRPKRTGGVYALIGKAGDATTVHTEYLIQLGVLGELVDDHGWSPGCLLVECGEFDLVGYREDGSDDVVLAVEAKARVRGRDSLEGLLRALVALSDVPAASATPNARRKHAELRLLCAEHPVTLWLVAAGARWSFTAVLDASGQLNLTPAGPPRYAAVLAAATP